MFFAQLCSGHGYIHVPADRMEIQENVILVYCQDQLMAAVDLSVVLFAHICERRTNDRQS